VESVRGRAHDQLDSGIEQFDAPAPRDDNHFLSLNIFDLK